jgi:hypothetical protein
MKFSIGLFCAPGPGEEIQGEETTDRAVMESPLNLPADFQAAF